MLGISRIVCINFLVFDVHVGHRGFNYTNVVALCCVMHTIEGPVVSVALGAWHATVAEKLTDRK